ncbi:MAG TPA: hypothetical protein VF832_05925, partial [Longimicrobiales bacterium]
RRGSSAPVLAVEQLRQRANPRRRADRVRIDEQTTRDLEIFQAQGRGGSLFDMLDRTRTAGGRDALRARFRKPLRDARRIRSVQDSLRFIRAHRGVFERLPPATQLAEVTHYLSSNLVTSASGEWLGAAVQAVWAFVFYRDLYREAAAGTAATRRLLDSVETFLVGAFLADATGEIRQILQEMSELLEDRHLRAARARRVGWGIHLQVLAADRAIRQDARAPMERLMRLVYELDALVSMADAGAARGFVLPQIVDPPGEVQVEGVYHPFLTEAVRNDLVLDERRRLLFLTGPNMAGKTTYLRACGIAVYLAHLGMAVPATAMRLSVFDALFTAIGLLDNVREGVSFFRAEALRVKEVARALAAGEHVLGILDEPFKGTNVRDALDASRAVLRRLAHARGSAFLVASHLIELADDLQSVPQVMSRRFEAREDGRELHFDYLARPGVSAQRLGMRVLEEEGVFALFDGGREDTPPSLRPDHGSRR